MHPVRLNVELRSAAIEGNTLSGMAHVFGHRAFVGGRYEEMGVGAFDEALKGSDVRAFFNHDPAMLLGRQSSGTLRLEPSEAGLAYSVDLPNTSYANDLRELVARGDLDGASFAFIPGEVKFGKAADGTQVRIHTKVRSLVDISPVSLPAFTGTSVVLRSMQSDESIRSQLVRARARVHGVIA